jgi:competence protein ComEC
MRTPRSWAAKWLRAGRFMKVSLAGIVLALTVMIAGLSARPDGQVHITVLDVGQGDAILVEGDRGGRLLIDGGPDPDRLIVELDAQIPPWDRRIDVLILSHPHEDHAGGLPRLVQSYRIGRIFEPGMVGPGPAYHAFRADLAFQARTPELLSTGDRLQLDSIGLKVLWPDRGAVLREPPDGGTSINNVSIVMLGTFGAQRFLLTGDIEQEIDPVLLSRGLPRVDLLKVAHHGSRTSSTDAFLDAVHPRVAVVSVGAVNPYGHPAPETLARIEARGARVYRTDRNGSVEATLDGSILTLRADRGGPATAGRSDGSPTQAAPNVLGESGGLTSAAAAFRCAIAPATFGAIAAPPVPLPSAAGPSSDPAGTRPAAATEDGLYHRDDVHPIPGGGRGTPPLDQPVGARPAPRSSGRRGRRLAGLPDRRERNPRRPACSRSGSAASRRRQGAPQTAAQGPSDPRPPPR